MSFHGRKDVYFFPNQDPFPVFSLRHFPCAVLISKKLCTSMTDVIEVLSFRQYRCPLSNLHTKTTNTPPLPLDFSPPRGFFFPPPIPPNPPLLKLPWPCGPGPKGLSAGSARPPQKTPRTRKPPCKVHAFHFAPFNTRRLFPQNDGHVENWFYCYHAPL